MARPHKSSQLSNESQNCATAVQICESLQANHALYTHGALNVTSTKKQTAVACKASKALCTRLLRQLPQPAQSALGHCPSSGRLRHSRTFAAPFLSNTAPKNGARTWARSSGTSSKAPAPQLDRCDHDHDVAAGHGCGAVAAERVLSSQLRPQSHAPCETWPQIKDLPNSRLRLVWPS